MSAEALAEAGPEICSVRAARGWLNMINLKITEIKIPEKSGFFAGKDFAWSEITNFSLITGINGSGKTKLLEYIANSTQYNKNHIIRYIDVDYGPPTQKHANEIESGFERTLKIEDGKYLILDKNNNSHDWTNSKDSFKSNNVLKSLDYSIIDSIIKERKKFQNDLDRIKSEIPKREKFAKTFDIIDLLPADKTRDDSWDRIDRILRDFDLSIRVDRNNLNSGLGFLRFDPINSSEIPLEMKELSSGEKVAFALALWTWGNSEGQKTDILLIDEFDAHLNPSITEKFINIIKEYFVDLDVQVIMTTHNPSTVVYAKKADADVIWMSDGVIDSNMDEDDIIRELSNGLLDINQFTEDMQLLISKNNKICTVYTEGKHDRTHIKSAIKALKREEDFKDIYIFGCTGAETVPFFINLQTGQPKRIALFDSDIKGKNVSSKAENVPEIKAKLDKGDWKILFVSPKDGETIESLFDSTIRGNITNDKAKRQFATRMSKPENQTKENFIGFEALLNEIHKFAIGTAKEKDSSPTAQ
ncbi:MAG: ATP-binding protein [Pseudomonadota bacterium]|nr:ATP-binding protein [Pseudomonadota bacterium]MDE3037507.1 ATP-binding protein [Pseudomonadota bacterium]